MRKRPPKDCSPGSWCRVDAKGGATYLRPLRDYRQLFKTYHAERTFFIDMYESLSRDTKYLLESVGDAGTLPAQPFTGEAKGQHEEAQWALLWVTGEATPLAEPYVNLIPTPQGGTHVSGLRTGLTEALRDYCEFRSLLPRGVRIAPEDVWDGAAYVLSVKLEDPQFSGQTKERLSSRECTAFVSGTVKDAFALWLNQHPETGDQIAMRAIGPFFLHTLNKRNPHKTAISRAISKKGYKPTPRGRSIEKCCTRGVYLSLFAFFLRLIPPDL